MFQKQPQLQGVLVQRMFPVIFSRPNRWVSSRCGESKRKTFPQKGSLGIGEFLLGGFKYVLLSPLLGEMIQFD